MRQIDNMTPQELDTLALKGMTAPRTAGERPARDRYGLTDEQKARLLPNKAQHSPFPLRDTATPRELQLLNHADELAEALREIIEPLGQDEIDDCWQYKEAQQALAAYEAAQ